MRGGGRGGGRRAARWGAVGAELRWGATSAVEAAVGSAGHGGVYGRGASVGTDGRVVEAVVGERRQRRCRPDAEEMNR